MRRTTCSVVKTFSSVPFGRPSTMRNMPIAFATSNDTFFPSMLTNYRGISNNNTPKIGNKRQIKIVKSYQKNIDQNPLNKSIDEICASIDTTLTPEQQVYVDMLKKQITGGAKSQLVRCKFLLLTEYFPPPDHLLLAFFPTLPPVIAHGSPHISICIPLSYIYNTF